MKHACRWMRFRWNQPRQKVGDRAREFVREISPNKQNHQKHARHNFFSDKEMMHREFESIMRKEKSEVALKVITKCRDFRCKRKGRKKGKISLHIIDSATRRKIVGRIREWKKKRNTKYSRYQIEWREDGDWIVVQAPTCAFLKKYSTTFDFLRKTFLSWLPTANK